MRRLLENGANTSFVNRFMDGSVPVEQVVADPEAQLAAFGDALAHPGIPLPDALYGAARRNSRGLDIGGPCEGRQRRERRGRRCAVTAQHG
ncbi:MAG: hypothetical protein ACKOUS_22320, partial [Alphaproteobacteria bacterium]